MEPSRSLLFLSPVTLSSAGTGAACRHTTPSQRLSLCTVRLGTRTSDVPQVPTFPPGLLTISITENQSCFQCPENQTAIKSQSHPISFLYHCFSDYPSCSHVSSLQSKDKNLGRKVNAERWQCAL